MYHKIFTTYGSGSERIFRMDIREVFGYYSKIIDDENEKKVYGIWLQVMPVYLQNGKYLSYEEFKNQMTNNPTNKRINTSVSNINNDKSDEVIMEDTINILTSFGKNKEVK